MKITIQYQMEKDDQPIVFLRQAYNRCQSFDRLRFYPNGNSIEYPKETPRELRCCNRLFDGQFDNESLPIALSHLDNVATLAMTSAADSIAPDDISAAGQNLADRIAELSCFVAQCKQP